MDEDNPFLVTCVTLLVMLLGAGMVTKAVGSLVSGQFALVTSSGRVRWMVTGNEAIITALCVGAIGALLAVGSAYLLWQQFRHPRW